MGTHSYILLGTEEGMGKTFGSACHGAGRTKSRRQAKKAQRGKDVAKRLMDKGIVVRYHSAGGVAEEAPEAYKDVDEVVDCIEKAGLSRKLARLVPIINIKG
jgi:tRNA-splicing ligase RtcB